MKSYKVILLSGGFFHVAADTWGKDFGPGYTNYVFYRGEHNHRAATISSDLVHSVIGDL